MHDLKFFLILIRRKRQIIFKGNHMAKRTKSYGLNNPLQDVFPVPVKAERAPTAKDTRYEIGQVWVDQTSTQIYGLSSVASGAATWTLLGAGTSDLESLTGDTGGDIFPTAGNINILGGAGVTVTGNGPSSTLTISSTEELATLTGDTGGPLTPVGANINVLGGDGLTVNGSGDTLTVNRDANGFPITPFVVGPTGQAGYSTIQAGVNAANTAGGGMVWIQSGTYNENLTLFDGITLIGDSEQNTIIVGTHTPPTTGTLNISRVTLQGTNAILQSAAAGSTTIIVEDTAINVTNGHAFDLVNWTGSVTVFDIRSVGTNDGFFRNTGGGSFFAFATDIGSGTGQALITSGTVLITSTSVECPIDFQTGTTATLANTLFSAGVTLSNNSIANFSNCTFSTGSSAAIRMDSSGAVNLTSCGIESTNSPAIMGVGAGILTLNGVDFLSDFTLASTLSILGGNTKSGTFETSNALNGLQISGNTIISDGTPPDVNINITTKGSGNIVANASIFLPVPGTGLSISGIGGAAKIGTVILTNGAGGFADSTIAVTDRVFLSRSTTGISTTLGILTFSITPAAGVTILSKQLASPAITELGDQSSVDYVVIREI